ncbi:MULTISPECIES: hypothetical protein [Streptomyces]|uniref:Uncharacterized protein n=1 Tax=Streptomyces ehimensis TaxID=68195 RepID=A0ABV9BB70_9ACTN
MADAWAWEYDPDPAYVIGGIDNLDASGMFVYQVVPRHQRVYIRQVAFLGS